MTSTLPLPSPGGYGQAYAESYRITFDKLGSSNLNDICHNSGASIISVNSMRLKFMGHQYTIDTKRRTITSAAGTLQAADSLIMLHYLVTATDKPPSGTQPVTFRELPGGKVYYPTFIKRAISPVIIRFEKSLDQLVVAARQLGGEQVSLGDLAVGFEALPRVTVTWVIWKGDGEFPTEGTILFNSRISNYLPTEDIAVLCQSIALKLCDIDTENTKGYNPDG